MKNIRKTCQALAITTVLVALSASISSCGSAAMVQSRKHYNCDIDTTIIVKEQMLRTFLDRNIPDYKSDKKDGSSQSAYGITIQDAFEHYSRKKLKYNVHLAHDANSDNAISEKPQNAADLNGGSQADAETELDQKAQICPDKAQLMCSCIAKPIKSTGSNGLKPETAKDKGPEILCARIVFNKGSSDIEMTSADNIREIEKIQLWIDRFLSDSSITLDTIVIKASASPEGKLTHNLQLSKNRGNAVVALLGKMLENNRQNFHYEHQATFNDMLVLKVIPENWEMLEDAVANDRILTFEQKMDFVNISEISDYDKREIRLSARPYYNHIKDSIYPELRCASLYIMFHKAETAKHQRDLTGFRQ